MAQTNLAVAPMTNAPAAENPEEQLLRDRIQELEERIRKLEEALAATKAPPTKPGADDYPYPPTPGTWVATDGTRSRFTISPMTEAGPWLKIQAWGFRNGGRGWGEVPLGYRGNQRPPVGFAAWHIEGGSFFLILRFEQMGINAEEIFSTDEPTNVSPKVDFVNRFFVPQNAGDGP
ncbi:MAG: hypothetical protein ABSC18_04675 [Verrucomicrobiota bacterium]|jgi:hypothetical protein